MTMPDDFERMEVVKRLVREKVDCGCCTINEDAVQKIASYLVTGLGYTDEELSNKAKIDEEIDMLYNYEAWTHANT